MSIFFRMGIFLLFVAVLFTSCEEEFIPDIVEAEPDIVVEGYIEAGENANPPFVILTRSVPFFSEINTDEFNNLFVRDAIVTITEGDNEYELTEFCLDELTPEQQAQAAELFGLNPDSLEANFCVYLDFSFSLMGEVGKTYDLKIEAEGKTLTSSTTIPQHVPIDSLFLVDAPGVPNDTLRQMNAFIDDPAGAPNYYRYFSGVNDGPILPGFNSIVDDAFFDGLYFEFVLPKSEVNDPNVDIDPNTFGLYTVGDTATIKWCTVDKAHFDFWNTLEFNAANQGPFSSYTRIESNINGGLGIWGGYSVSYYTRVVD